MNLNRSPVLTQPMARILAAMSFLFVTTIAVANINQVPEFLSEPITTAIENTEYLYEVIAIDEDDDELTYLLTVGPDGMTMEEGIRTITWLPGYDAAGTYPVVIQVFDGFNTTTQSFDVVVANTNRNPTIEATFTTTVAQNTTYQYQIVATDDDGDTLYYELSERASGMTMSSDGLVTWLAADIGEFFIEIYVYDAMGGFASVAFNLTVFVENNSPIIVSAPLTIAEEGEDYQYAVIATDADEDALTYQLTKAPVGMTLNSIGVISWAPNFNQSGNHAVKLSVSDGTAVATQSYTIAVVNTNRAPVLTAIADQTVAENQMLSIALHATDVDEDTLIFSLNGIPNFVSLDGSQLIVTPGFGDADIYGGITVIVSDGVDSHQITFIIDVTSINRAPEISSTAVTVGVEGDDYQYTVIATDADEDALTYQLTKAPVGMTLNPIGVISWAPNFNQSGNHAVKLSVSDGTAVATQSYTIAVVNTNRAPVLTAIADQTVAENGFLSIALQASDVDEDTLTFSVEGLPNFASLDGADIYVTPGFGDAGAYGGITVTVSDGVDSQQTTFIINVTSVNRAPEITTEFLDDANVNEAYEYSIVATDPDEDPLNYSLLVAPLGMVIGELSGVISWFPESVALEGHSITVAVDDGVVSVERSYLLTVVNSNVSPVIGDVLDDFVLAGTEYLFTPDIFDEDGDLLTLSLVDAPEPMLVVDDSFEWQTTLADLGEYTVKFSVSDGQGGYAEQEYVLTVFAENNPPSIVSDALTVAEEGNDYQYAVIATDADEDALTYQLITAPSGMTLSPIGVISWSPDFNQSGNHSVEVSVSDGTATAIQSYTIAVANTNRPPVLTAIIDQTVVENQSLDITLQAVDVDGDTLTFSVMGLPSFATLVGSEITVSPDYDAAGNYGPVSVTVNDGVDSAVETFSISVTNLNQVPEIVSSPVTVAQENVNYIYVVNAIDLDGELLNFTLKTHPEDMEINAVSGEINWVPNFDQEGSHAVVVEVTDQSGGVLSHDFTIDVEDVNRNPVITTTALPDALEGGSYNVTVEASDPDGDALTFSLSTAPAGLVIDSTTGELSSVGNVTWTPNNVGAYSVTIHIDDGRGGIAEQNYQLQVVDPEPNHEGSDFWLTFGENHTGNTPLYLYISGQQATSGLVSVPLQNIEIPFDIVPGEITKIELDSSLYTYPYSWVAENEGIHVTAQDPVVVYGLNQKDSSTDGFLVMPTSSLGDHYKLMTYNNGQVNLLATEDNTSITLTFSEKAQFAGPIIFEKGDTHTVMLNKGETFAIQNIINTLTGTDIRSTAPIAVFAGDKCAYVPASIGWCDHIVEQMPAMQYWGMRYVMVPLALRYGGDTVRVLASTDGTEVRFNGELVSTLNEGEVMEDLVAEATVISANHPVLAAQFSNGADFDWLINGRVHVGDPFMMLLTAEENFITNYTMSTPDEAIESNFVNVVIAEDGINSVLLDGNLVDSALFSPLGSSDLWGAQLPIQIGAHNLHADLPMAAYIYGFSDADSYGYQGGMKLLKYTPEDLLQVTATELVPSVSDNICLAIDFNATNGGVIAYPLVGSRIDIAISGTNPKTVHALSDEQGQANYCYVGGHAGVDTIRISAGLVSQQLEVNWQNAVGDGNSLPIIVSEPVLDALFDQPYSYAVEAYDADVNTGFTYGLLNEPNGMTISDAGLITWSPTSVDEGQYSIDVQVSDDEGNIAAQNYTLSAYQGNRAPIFTREASRTVAYVGHLYNANIDAEDPDGDKTYCQMSLDDGSRVNSSLNHDACISIFATTFGAEDVGEKEVTIRAYDRKGAESFYTYTLTIILNQLSELVEVPLTQARVGSLYESSVVWTDPDPEDVMHYEINWMRIAGTSSSINLLAQGLSIDSSTGAITWLPDNDDVGSYSIRIIGGDPIDPQYYTFILTVYPEDQPLSAGLNVSPQYVQPGESVNITASSVSAAGLVDYQLQVDGQNVTLDADNQAVFTQTQQIGRHRISLAVEDGSGQTNTIESFFSVVDSLDTDAPIVSLNSPGDMGIVTAPTPIFANISDASLSEWRLLLMPVGKPEYAQVLASGYNQVSNEEIAVLDPTQLTNGQYHLQLEASDSGERTSYDAQTIIVDGNLKVGNFTYGVDIITVPMAGMPITVSRTYDSRRKHEMLDFGYGWFLSYNGIKLEKTRTLGEAWSSNQYTGGLLNVIVDYCVEPLGSIAVSVTLPNGQVDMFDVNAAPHCSTSVPNLDVKLNFTASGNTQSSLRMAGDTPLRLVNGNLEILGSNSIFDSSDFILTTRQGYEYHFNTGTGISFVQEPNGHSLTFNSSGVHHSSGKSIKVNHNKNKVYNVTTPNQDVFYFEYDLSENLIHERRPDKTGQSYTYNYQHGLVDIIDPLGRNILKNFYEDGRLVAQEDNDGNRTNFIHDIEGRQSTVTDRDNNITFFYYDDNGNVLEEIKIVADGDITTSYTYDANNNQTTKTIGSAPYTWISGFDADNNQLFAEDPVGFRVSYENHNARGQETEIYDELNRKTEMHYDVVGNLYQIDMPALTDPDSGGVNILSAGNVINSKGQVDQTTDLRGQTTSYTYYPSGHVSAGQKWTESNNISGTVTYTYDANNNVLTEARERTVNGSVVGETVLYEYDKRDRLTVTTYPDSSYTESEYDLAGNMDRERDRFGIWTDYDYDVYGRLRLTTYTDGTTEIRDYSKEGLLKDVTDRMGRTTHYDYDDAARLWKTTFHDNTFTETQYTPQGWVQFEWDEKRNQTEYEYFLNGRRKTVIRHTGAGTTRHSYTYYDNGELLTETDPLMQVTTYSINEFDQRIATAFHNGTTVGQRYDAMGARVKQIDQNNIETIYGYDDLGRLDTVTPNVLIGSVPVPDTVYSYDEVGNKLTQTDAEGRQTSWTYDYYGRVLTRTLPELMTESFVYDDVARTVAHMDFNGNTNTTYLDDLGRVDHIDYHDVTSEAYTYWGNGQLHTVTDQHGVTETAFDDRDRLAYEIKPDGTRLDYAYDNAGNRTQVKVTRGTIITTTDYTYDQLNRLETVIDTSGITTYTYYDNGNLNTVTAPNGIVTDYDYNSVNQLTVLTTKNAAGSVLSSYTYGLGDAGRREDITEADGRFTDYIYDDLYRLTDEVVIESGLEVYNANYVYDWVGNRQYETVGGVQTQYAYDLNDRLISQGGTTYTHDDNGNTKTETLDSVITEYFYDAKNKLTSVDKGGVVTSYSYDSNGIRNSKTEAGVTTNYVVDLNRDYAQVLEEVIGDIGTASASVSYSYGHDLLSQDRGGDFRFYAYDGLGSTRVLTDDAGVVTDTYDYEAFGEVLNSTGESENSYKYAGEQLDDETGNYYLRARYMDPAVGRFTQQDTYMGNSSDPVTLHKYLYANANPVSYIDPTGNFSIGGMMGAVNVMNILSRSAQASYSYFGGFVSQFGDKSSSIVDDRRKVYLDFSEMSIGYFDSGAVKAKILNKVKSDFSSYGVKVEVGRGTALDNKVKLLGDGVSAGLPHKWDANETMYGVRYFNQGFVWTDSILQHVGRATINSSGTGSRSITAGEAGTAIGNVVSHEVGHIFGASHVSSSNYIMGPGVTIQSLGWSSSTSSALSKRFD